MWSNLFPLQMSEYSWKQLRRSDRAHTASFRVPLRRARAEEDSGSVSFKKERSFQ